MSVIDIIINIIMCSVLNVEYLFIVGTLFNIPIKLHSSEIYYYFNPWASGFDNGAQRGATHMCIRTP